MSSGESSGAASEEKVDIVLRSPDPTKLRDLRLTVPLRWCVDELKWLIAAEHPRKPAPNEQVLIYGGKVLTNGQAPLVKVLRRGEPREGPYTLHLALRSEEPLTQSASAPNLTETHAQGGSTSSGGTVQASMPSPVVALPIVMMNPVVSAAYNAAMAVVSNPGNVGGTAQGGVQQSGTPSTQPLSVRGPSPAGTSSGQQMMNVPQQQPMVPAIAFFPLGIPVLVPAAAQNQGFQIGQAIPQMQPPVPVPQQRHVQRRPVAQPIGRRHGHGGNMFHPRGRGVVVYRFSLRGLIQLALIIAVLYAYCSRERFIIGVVVFVLLYLFARPLRRLIHDYYNARDAEGRQQPRGMIHEMLAIALTLISSLFPNWNANEGNGVPFARVIREEAADENRAVAPQDHPHAD